MRHKMILAAVTIALALGVNYAQAQAPTQFQVNYFSNANTAGAPDATMRITIQPTQIAISGDVFTTAPKGAATGNSVNACSNIYVFNANEEISECCSCLNTPNGLDTLSVNTNLTSNPLTGPKSTTGTIEVLQGSPIGGICPAAYLPNPPGLNFTSWVTHIQNSNWTITETPSQVVTLSEGELVSLENQCYAIALVGSGDGVCSCGVNK